MGAVFATLIGCVACGATTPSAAPLQPITIGTATSTAESEQEAEKHEATCEQGDPRACYAASG